MPDLVDLVNRAGMHCALLSRHAQCPARWALSLRLKIAGKVRPSHVSPKFVTPFVLQQAHTAAVKKGSKLSWQNIMLTIWQDQVPVPPCTMMHGTHVHDWHACMRASQLVALFGG